MPYLDGNPNGIPVLFSVPFSSILISFRLQFLCFRFERLILGLRNLAYAGSGGFLLTFSVTYHLNSLSSERLRSFNNKAWGDWRRGKLTVEVLPPLYKFPFEANLSRATRNKRRNFQFSCVEKINFAVISRLTVKFLLIFKYPIQYPWYIQTSQVQSIKTKNIFLNKYCFFCP